MNCQDLSPRRRPLRSVVALAAGSAVVFVRRRRLTVVAVAGLEVVHDATSDPRTRPTSAC